MDRKVIFDKPIIKEIQYAQSVKINKIKKQEHLTKEKIDGKLKDINNYNGNWSGYYNHKAVNGHRKSEDIL